MAETTYNITLTANHQTLTAKYLPLAAESVQYLTAKVVYETDDWTGREIKAMFEHGRTVYEVPVIDGKITAKQQLNLTAGDWRVWLVGNSARDGDVIPRITTNVAHIRVAPTGGTEGSPFPTIPPTVEEQLRADMGNLADLTTEDKSSLVAAINEARQTGGGVQSDWNQNDETAPDYVKNRPFYTGDPVETVLLEETTATFAAEEDGLYGAIISADFSPEIGTTYKVSWDGTVYSCVCYELSGLPAIGNQYIITSTSDTGEPFIAGVNSNNRTLMIYTQDTSASHTISISGTAVPVVKIDPKYIRDMYYTGDPVETVLVEESTVTFSFSENSGVYMGRLKSTFSATVGETYKVYWDGAAYECACVNFNNRPFIGNLSIAGAGSDSGEPFCMIVLNGGGIKIATADTSASHTVSISATAVPVVKIDEKYLPDSIISDISTAQSTANDAQSTANDALNTANTARSTANAANTAAENAQTTAKAARSTANAAKTEVAKALTVNSSGSISAPTDAMNDGAYQSLNLSSKDQHHSVSFKVTESVGLQIWVSRDHGLQSSPSNPSTVEFIANGALRMRLKGIDELIMNSSTAGSTKKFKITVDDSGTLTATEVT